MVFTVVIFKITILGGLGLGALRFIKFIIDGLGLGSGDDF